MDNNLLKDFNKIIGNNSNYYFFLTFIKNKDFLIQLFESLNKTIKNYYDCKDYYFTLKIPFTELSKTYSKNDIIQLFKLIPNYHYENNDNDIIDQFYLYYVYYKEYFLNLFNALQKAITDYYKVKDFNYIFIVPELFQKKYNIQKLNLDALTIIKLYNISTNYKYILPLPTDFI